MYFSYWGVGGASNSKSKVVLQQNIAIGILFCLCVLTKQIPLSEFHNKYVYFVTVPKICLRPALEIHHL